MNKVLNMLARRLVRVLMSHRWTRLLVLVVVSATALVGSLSLYLDDRPAQAGGANSATGSYQLTGRVVRVSDGDTFNLRVGGKQERVRMASIDAPELTKDRERPGQPMAQASKDALSLLISGKTLTLVCFERDRYERNICDVPLDDGSTANRKQVQAGMAWANMEGRGKFMRDPQMRSLEQQAKEKRRGIWKHDDAVSPWAWRYQCWQEQRC